jgi:hypothetical protein
MLGDSMTEGIEVDLGALYWKQLETLLPACPAFAERQVEVMGFAVNGYGTAQEYLTLQQRVLKYHPDLVLLAVFTGNDLTDNSLALGQHRDRPYYTIADGRLVLSRVAGDAADFTTRQRWDRINYQLHRLRIVQLASEAAWRAGTLLRFRGRDSGERAAIGLDAAIYRPPQTAEWRDAWTLLEALILEIDKTARANGAAFAMTTLTTPAQADPDLDRRAALAARLGTTDLSYPDRRLAEFAARHDLPDIALIDRLPDYAARHHVALHGFDPAVPIGHWNAQGHRVAAEALAQGLCQAMASGRLAPPR